MKKKVLIIILAVVVVLGAALGAFKIYSNQKKLNEEIINLLMNGEGVSAFQLESMLNGEYDTGERYLKIKDTDKFKEQIYSEVEEFLNEHEDARNLEYVNEKLSVIKREGLLNDAALKLLSDYEINCAKEYAQMLSTAIESGDYEEVAEDLAWLVEQDAIKNSGIDISDMLNKLMENCQIYSLKNNTGAYYDDIELRSSSSYRNEGVEWMDPIGYTSRSYVEKAYGDFCIGTSHSRTHYEALEGYDFENKYNTDTTTKTLYLRGREINGHFWSDTLKYAANNGAKYIICFENSSDGDEIEMDGILMFGDDKLYPMAYMTDNADSFGIDGDFSQQIKDAKKLYDEKFSAQFEIDKAAEFVKNKQYEEAMNILQYYTHIDGALDQIYAIAVDSIRQGDTELGLRILENVPFFDMIKGLDWDYMVEHLDGRFDPDINNKEYTKQFLRLLMDVVGEMKEEDITTALSGKNFKQLPQGTFNFNEDGTGASKRTRTGSTVNFNWTVQDGKLFVANEGNGKANVYSVYNVLPGYYLLAYTTENSSHVFMTLLKG